MTATSKRILDRLHRSQTVETATTRYAAAATAGCAGVFAPVSAADLTSLDIGAIFHTVGHHLARRRRQLQAADRDLVAARQRRIALRQRQDAAAAAVRAELVEVRRLLKSFWSAAEVSRLLGLAGPTPREASRLLGAVHGASARLADPARHPAPRTEGVVVDFAALAARLASVAATLDAAMTDLDAQRWRERDALDAQRRALSLFDRVYGTVARFVEATLELAGHDALARRVRPGVGRRGRPPAASRQAISSPPTAMERLQKSLRKACAHVAGRWRRWRKGDLSETTAQESMKKSKMFPASDPARVKKGRQPWRQRFRRYDRGKPPGERRVA